MTETPADLACSLTDAELRARRGMAREQLLPSLAEAEELENGFRLAFAASADIRERVEEFVELERACCSFLDFDVSAGEAGRVVLDMTGPEGTKDVLKDFAALVRR